MTSMNKRWNHTLAWTVLVAALLLALQAGAQVGTSSITGVVNDPSGARIPGARVTALNEQTNISYQTTTTAAGTYAFASVPVGSYTITVEAQGFKKWVGQHNVLNVGAPLVVNITLQVGSLESTVRVEGAYERLQTTNATISDVVTGSEIRNLPLNGRNPLNLINIEPGLIQTSTNAVGSGTHINGSRDRAFNVTLDGIDVNEPSVPNPQNNVFRLNTDNVAEYRILTVNATPEFGRNSGANIVLTTRSGTNEFHGDIYEYFRNPVLDANEWFANALGQARGNFKLNQFGASVGGPIVRNHAFFFGSWEGQRLAIGMPIAEAFGSVPAVYTSAARQGLFRYVVGTVNGLDHNSPALVDSQGNLLPGIPTCSATITTNCIATYNIPANDPQHIGISSVMGSFFNATPAPNNFQTIGDGLNIGGFVWSPGQTQPEEHFLGRVDYQIDDRNSLFARYMIAFADTKGGDFLNGRPTVFPGFPPLGGVVRRPSGLAVGYRHTFSPELVNEFTMGYSRFLFSFLFGKANPNFPNIPPYSPSNVTTPYNIFGPQTARTLTTIQYVDNLSFNHGSHFYRTGFNIRFLQHNDARSFVGSVVAAPQVSFSASARLPENAGFVLPSNMSPDDKSRLEQTINELLGIPSSIGQAFFADGLNAYDPDGQYVRGARIKQYDLYVQDEWKATRRLSLTYGFRYEYNPPGTEARNLILAPDKPVSRFSQTGPITFIPKDHFWHRQNGFGFLPRVGAAWDPFGSGKMVVRAGFGMSFDTISTFQLVPILGLVPGSSAACTVSIKDTSGGPVASSSSTFCPIPAGATARVGQGFPTSLPQPTALPGSFVSPAVQSSLTAPPAGGIDPNLKNPTVYQWDLSIQRDLGHEIILEVAYVGTHGVHLLRGYNLNQLRINHDGYIQDFIQARNNYLQCNNPNGTSSCGQKPQMLASLFGGTIPSTSRVTTDLIFNAAGDLAALIDSSFFSQMVAATGRPDFFRPNPQFGSFFWMDSGGNSVYHGLQVRVRRHEPNLDFGGSFTFGKSIDDMSNDPVGAVSSGAVGNNSRTPTNIYNFRIDRGRSDFDRTMVFTSYFIWNLPFGRGQRWGSGVAGWLNQIIGGWSSTGLVTVMTGEPFSVLSGRFTDSNIRHSYAQLVGQMPHTNMIFNAPGVIGPTMFDTGTYISSKTNPLVGCLPFNNGLTFLCTPPPGSDGNLGRNVFNGPGYFNVDLSVGKRFPITERWALQFRADFFNAFNHPNFDNPRNSTNGSFRINSSVFGQTCCFTVGLPSNASVIALGEPYRVVQLAMRLTF